MTLSDTEYAVATAAARLFRSYDRHCVTADDDALFDFLNALHSFGDKIGALGRPNLNPSHNFQALRALRNLYHHEAELLHASRTISAENVPTITSDLATLCLIPDSSVERLLARARDGNEREAIRATVHRYGSAANVEPAIFNVMVDAYELMSAKGITPDEATFARFRDQYDFEILHGYNHRVTGTLSTHAGSISNMLATLLQAPERAG
jgi:hypothetical protein